ncbi:hypothetical protein ALC57_00802 [Trachymyrmex cornetzi]|uniref:Uncharacterized protein n=1 Tax=Trachymyrmex cornetzi TaxID=471704 RepID=A0A151JRI7_9HYME|nr:hypothetical protein ALC57_00802 [Trachymyrmex cornetzi]
MHGVNVACDSPECPCGDPRQGINHIIFYCRLCTDKSHKLCAYLKKRFPTSIDIHCMINNPSLTLCPLITAYLKSLKLNI